MQKPEMSLEFAQSFLGASAQDILKSHEVGDSEISWLRDGNEVAYGYFSDMHSWIFIKGTKKFAPTRFKKKHAEILKHAGKCIAFSYN